MTAPTGTCNYCRETCILTIKTKAKRGKKMVDNVQTYLVEDSRPDTRVADPAYSLTKGMLIPLSMEEAIATGGETHKWVASGDVWHVSVNEWGPECDCPHRTFNPDSPLCKHARAMKAVGLLTRKGN